jgi:hypothetical protein
VASEEKEECVDEVVIMVLIEIEHPDQDQVQMKEIHQYLI